MRRAFGHSKAFVRVTKRALSLMALFFISALFSIGSQAGTKPSWYPHKSCRSAWKGHDRTKFDPARDRDYGAYKHRLQQEQIDRRACHKDWTVLVYMAADNDLSPYALWDLAEMEGRFAGKTQAGSTLNSDLVVQVDTDDLSGVRRLHMFQRNDRPYRAPRSKSEFAGLDLNSIASPVVSMEPETATQDKPSHAERLRAFLAWALREYPSENTMVVLWGHGQGWTAYPPEPTTLPGRLLNEIDIPGIVRSLPQPAVRKTFGGVLFLPQTGERLTIPDLRDIFSDVVTRTLEGNPIDLYVSDACLMQMAEVATELAPFTRYISGSAQVQSYLGLPYRRLMYEINSGRYLGASRLTGGRDRALLVAKMLPSLAEQSFNPTKGDQGKADPEAHKNFTMSSLYSAGLMTEFSDALSAFSLAMIDYLNEDQFRALDVALVMRSAPSFMGGGKDLGAFLGLLRILLDKERLRNGGSTPRAEHLYRQLDRLIDSVDESTVARAYGESYLSASTPFYLLGYRAFGIWIPSNLSEFTERKSDFAQSTVHRNSHWLEWLSLILSGR